eukprot:g20138.t1
MLRTLLVLGYQKYALHLGEAVVNDKTKNNNNTAQKTNKPAWLLRPYVGATLSKWKTIVSEVFVSHSELSKGKTVLDIGANNGLYALTALFHGGAKHVTLFEPDARFGEKIYPQIAEMLAADPGHREREFKYDLVLALAHMHWLFACTEARKSVEQILRQYAFFVKPNGALLVEWVPPPGVEAGVGGGEGATSFPAADVVAADVLSEASAADRELVRSLNELGTLICDMQLDWTFFEYYKCTKACNIVLKVGALLKQLKVGSTVSHGAQPTRLHVRYHPTNLNSKVHFRLDFGLLKLANTMGRNRNS